MVMMTVNSFIVDGGSDEGVTVVLVVLLLILLLFGIVLVLRY